MLHAPEAFDKQLHYVEVDLTHKKGCSKRTQKRKQTKKNLKVDFNFDVDLETSSATEPDELEHSFDNRKVVFKHKYKIENSGTSPLNKNETLYLYIPEIAKDVDIRMNEDLALCHENNETISDVNPKLENKKSSEISCHTDSCRRKCKVKPGLVKQNPLLITIAMTLDPDQIYRIKSFDGEKFKIVTKLELNGDVKSSTTEFERNDVGKIEAVFQWWPIILGVAIAAAVFVACVYGIVKSGLFEKARIFNDYDDPEETEKLNDETKENQDVE